MTLRRAQDRSFGERAALLARLSARHLGWRPDEFWRSTPAELATLFSDEVEPVASEELARLMARYPDKEL